MNLKYNDLQDGELIMLYKEQNEDAEKILYLKYYYLIPCIIKKYSYNIKLLNMDLDDVYAECLNLMLELFLSYDENKNASLKTYLNFCLDRKIKFLIRKKIKDNDKFLSQYSLDDSISDDATLLDVVENKKAVKPLESLLCTEDIKELVKKILPELSKKEKKIFLLLLNNTSLLEISKKLDISLKNINNYIYRIKNKTIKMMKFVENG